MSNKLNGLSLGSALILQSALYQFRDKAENIENEDDIETVNYLLSQLDKIIEHLKEVQS